MSYIAILILFDFEKNAISTLMSIIITALHFNDIGTRNTRHLTYKLPHRRAHRTQPQVVRMFGQWIFNSQDCHLSPNVLPMAIAKMYAVTDGRLGGNP